jgi:hypothetical protein
MSVNRDGFGRGILEVGVLGVSDVLSLDIELAKFSRSLLIADAGLPGAPESSSSKRPTSRLLI